MALVENKKALLNYEILEKFEAGVELFGHEVKSLRDGKGSLDGAYVSFKNGEAYLVRAAIPQYQAGNVPASYDTERPRRLLLARREIDFLIGRTAEGGLTVVPISIYNKGNRLKLGIALVRGKKKYDKREILKKRDAMREVERTLKRE